MEQKRVLWIVAAVGLFLLVVIGTALWISSPSSKIQPTLNTLQNSGNSWSRNDSQLQPTGSNVIIADTSAGQNGITNIDFSSTGNGQAQAPVNLNNLDSTAPAASNTPSDSTAQNTAPAAQTAPSSTDNRTSSAGLAQTAVTLNVNITPSSSNATAYTEAPQQTVQPAQVSAAPAETKPATMAPAASSAPAATTSNTTSSKPAATSTSTTSSKPAATTTTAASTTTAQSSASSVKTVPVSQPDQFWVQVASFTGKKNAEDARAALAEQKIIGEVFTYQDSKGTIYYRLRVGPYKTKSEAEYWHKIIKEVEQFKGTDSYVVNSTVK